MSTPDPGEPLNPAGDTLQTFTLDDLAQAQQNPGFAAQNNMLVGYVNGYEIAKFSARLDYEHGVAVRRPQPGARPRACFWTRGTPGSRVC